MQLTNEKKNKLKQQQRSLNDELKAQPELVLGLFPRGFMSLVASPPGIGKTWLTLFLCSNGSLGYDYLGRSIRPAKAIIMSGETGIDMLIHRIHKTNWPYDANKIILYSSFQMSMAGIECSLNTEEGRQVLLEIIMEHSPDIIIFDTLISFHTFDESKQQEMSRLYLYLCKLASTFNFALVLNHHTRKRSSQNPNRALEQDDIIGTSAGIRLAASAFVLQPNEDETDSTSFVLKNVKSWSKRISQITFRLRDIGGNKVDFYVDSKLDDDDTVKHKVIVAVLKNAVKGSVFRVKDMAVRFHSTERTIRKYLEAYCQPDEETGTVLLNRIQIGAETLYVGTLTLAELASYKKNTGQMGINAEEIDYKPNYSGTLF